MPYFGGFYYDSLYIAVMIVSIIITFGAQFLVKSVFSRYSKEMNRNNITGAEAARKLLDSKGLYDVRIERIKGSLTDHYDPKAKVLRLSETVYDKASVAAVGVACHEAGHAIQHDEVYAALWLRSAMVPVTNIVSPIGMYMIMFGLILKIDILLPLGVLMFSASTIFTLITLPVEFNASSRANEEIAAISILDVYEQAGCRKVLRAAAMTYVAAAVTSILQLLQILLRISGRRSRRR